MSAYAVRLSSTAMGKLGLHKQWINRPLEWQQNIKVVVTSTEWDNFFNLRLESRTVQPEMVELARAMKYEMDLSIPEKLSPGEWHLPYMVPLRSRYNDNVLKYVDPAGEAHDLDNAKMISTSACAQVSYRNLDTSLAKAINIVKRLSDRDDPHLSPFEHQATPIDVTAGPDGPLFRGQNMEEDSSTWQAGVTHVDRNGKLWSGNFQGWIQNRQLMEV